MRANGGGVPDSTSHKPLLSLNRDRRRRTAWCMTVTLVTPTPPRPRFESLSCPAAKPTLASDACGWLRPALAANRDSDGQTEFEAQRSSSSWYWG